MNFYRKCVFLDLSVTDWDTIKLNAKLRAIENGFSVTSYSVRVAENQIISEIVKNHINQMRNQK